MTALEAATTYTRRGWRVVPVPYREKNPGKKGWHQMRLTEADLPHHFDGRPINVGVLLGEPSGGLLDVDLDTPQAIALASHFLPPTASIFGRPGKPQSHWLFLPDPLVPTTKFFDVRGEAAGAKKGQTMLVELRSTGAQTIGPGSTHESGEPIAFFNDGDPARVDGNDLLDRVRRLAGATLISRHWPGKGARHHAANALAGALLRSGWSEDQTRDFIVAVARAAGDEESHNRGKLVDLTAAALERGGKATGWKTLAEVLGKDVATKAREWLGIEDQPPYFASSAYFAPASGNAPKAPPAPPEEPWPQRMEEPAYYGLAGEIVRALDPHTEADPVAVLVQILVGFGNVIGRSAHFIADATRHCLNLYAVLVGKTSKGRKGTSWSNARLLFDEVAPDWTKSQIASGLSSGEGLIWQVRDEVLKKVAVKSKGRYTGEYDTIIEHEGVADKRLLVLESEFATALKVMQREGNTLSPVIRLAWDSGNLRSMVKNSPARATDAHISIVGHVTKDEVTRYLDRTECANGLGNRFMWFCVRRSKCLPEGGKAHLLDLRPLAEKLDDAIELASEATLITRDAEARAWWCDVYPELSEGKPGIYGAMTGRAESQVMRVACVQALLNGSRIVKVEHLESALAIWRYAEASVKHIFGWATGDPLADEIDRALRMRPEGMSRTDISAYLGKHRDTNQISRALGLLAESRRACCITTQTTGRSVETWFSVSATMNATEGAKEAK